MQGIFKKSAIALAIFGFAGAASAGFVSGAFFGGEGLDLQARNGDLDFVTVLGTGTSPIGTVGLHPTYAWGWRLFGGLLFCNNNDATFSWLRYRHTNDNDFGTPVSPTALDTPLPSILRFMGPEPWSNIFADVDFQLDDAYLVFGHTVNLGAWSVRFAGGAEYAKIHNDMTVQGIEETVNSGLQILDELNGYDVESHFHGFGPRVELDFVYHLPYGLSAFAKPNVALIIGSRNIEVTNIFPDPENSDSLLDYEFTNRRVVIPKLGIKLGLGFTYAMGDVGGEGGIAGPFNNCGLTIEAGWQADTYIHAVERPEGFTTLTANNLHTRTSNFGIQGFFVGAILGTNWL